MIEPTPPRATVTDEPDGLRIDIPARRHWAAILFLAAWSIGWLLGEVAVPFQIFDPATDSVSKGFLSLWELGWTVAGAGIFYIWWWFVSGHEVLLFDPTLLIVTRRTTLFSRNQRFDLSQMEDLRASPVTSNRSLADVRGFFAAYGISGGHIAFDYGAKTYRFGAGIEEAEAKQIVALIKSRFPALGESHL